MAKLYIVTGNSSHRLKSAVDRPICVLKRGVLCGLNCHTICLHQNEVNLHNRETKWPPTSIFFSHAFAQVAQRKHKIRLAIAVSHCRPRLTVFRKPSIMFCFCPVVASLWLLESRTENASALACVVVDYKEAIFINTSDK